MVEIGSADHPIKVLFVPSVSAEEIIAGGEILKGVLEESTGLVYEVSVPTSYAATISEMCASPEDTVGFIPATAYVIGNDECGIEVAMKSLRFGFTEYWAEFIVPRDSEATSLADLAGKSWAYPDVGSTSGYLVPNGMFLTDGIEPGETVEAGGHSAVVKAVYNGEADFGTTFFSPPLLPEGRWAIGDAPEPYLDLLDECAPNDEGKLYCGDYRVLDARSSLATEAPDVVQVVGIVGITSEIPTDTMSFSPEFPADLKDVITAAVIDYIGSDACAETICNENFYDWTAAGPIADENFDGIRLLLEAQGITLENIGE